MTGSATVDPYGVLIEPATLKIQRLLPGPIERVWAYLTDSELRREWLAAGAMEMTVGTSFELVWRNDDLAGPSGQRPSGKGEEHRMQSRIVACDPPHRLVFTWQDTGDVSFELERKGDQVLLTLIHRRLPDRAYAMKVGPGWHAHLDFLVARTTGQVPTEPFWDSWRRLQQEYETRLPA